VLATLALEAGGAEWSVGITVGVLKDGEDPGAQPLGVSQGVQRERVLCGAGGIEEVRLGPRREHEHVAGVGVALGRRHGVRHRVDRGHLRQLHVDVVVVVEGLAQRGGDIGGGQLRCRDLVEQRLKLVVVALIDQRDVD